MNLERVEEIVNEVLYEGYVLYPYGPSGDGERPRRTGHRIYPRAHGLLESTSASSMQTKCLARGNADTGLEVHVRFLHLIHREVGEPLTPTDEVPPSDELDVSLVPSLTVNGQRFDVGEEAVECEVLLSALTIGRVADRAVRIPFTFVGRREIEPLRDSNDRVAGILIRRRATIEGEVTVSADAVEAGVYRVTARLDNLTSLDPVASDAVSEVERRSFAAAHAILGVRDGAFVSLFDPPRDIHEFAAACDNRGVWPVLVGENGATDTMLALPLELTDYPQPRSARADRVSEAADGQEGDSWERLDPDDAQPREIEPEDARMGQHGPQAAGRVR